MRGRNNNNNGNNNNNNGNRKTPNPLQRSYESNGPDVKVRGTAQHVAEKYLQLARDAQSSGDPVAAENYFQHAEHYYRILLAGQEQMAQQFGHSFPPNRGFGENADDGEEDGEDDGEGFQPANPQQNGPQQNGPQPEMRGQPHGGMNGNGYAGNGARQDGPRHDGEGQDSQQNNGQRFDRPGRNDRPNQNDRANNDRNGNRRFDRNDRQDRGERRFDQGQGGQGQSGQGQGGHAPRTDTPPIQAERPDAGQLQPQPAPSEPRFERPERAPRPERRPRREPELDAATETDVAAALPSFLTTPVRVPIAVVDEPVLPAQDAIVPDDGAGGLPKRPRGRRRSPREVMDALGSDGDSPAEVE